MRRVVWPFWNAVCASRAQCPRPIHEGPMRDGPGATPLPRPVAPQAGCRWAEANEPVKPRTTRER
eukprot:11215036-Lingulodinium_polyedra.AAC.1